MEKIFDYSPKTLRMWATFMNDSEGYETEIAILLNDLATAIDCGRLFMLNTKPEVELIGTMSAFNIVTYLRGRREYLEALIRTSNWRSQATRKSEAKLAEINNLLMILDPDLLEVKNR